MYAANLILENSSLSSEYSFLSQFCLIHGLIIPVLEDIDRSTDFPPGVSQQCENDITRHYTVGIPYAYVSKCTYQKTEFHIYILIHISYCY